MKVVNHKRLQQYKHHYGMVCLTGLLGCRWHRYQQSKEPASKCDVIWYVLLLVTSAFIVFWFYFWLLAENSAFDLNWFLYEAVGSWMPAYTLLFVLTCIALIYIGLLNILALCHLGYRHQIHLHWSHKVLVFLTFLGCITMVIVIEQLWAIVWLIEEASLMITGPFLHLSVVIFMTLITWFIADQWMTLYRTVSRVFCMILYIAAMLFLYIVPVIIDSPCITDKLPVKPLLVGHRGASSIRPENTELSFQAAANYVVTYETDVTVSFDGVPYLMHTGGLDYVTDVSSHWPQLSHLDACCFNISQIDSLDAGSWFLKINPYKTTKHLTKEERLSFVNQSVPHLSWLLQYAKATNKNVMFDISFLYWNECYNHPYAETYKKRILEVIKDSGIDHSQVWWFTKNKTSSDPATANMTFVYNMGHVAPLIWNLQQNDIDILNAEYGTLSGSDIGIYQAAGIKVNMYIVNSPWMYSLYWCMGVHSVTTDWPQDLTSWTKPVWALTPKQYQIMWVTTDVVSCVIVILIYVTQRLRRYNQAVTKTLQSERLSLQGARIRMSHLRKNRNMKEKLLRTVEGLQEVEPGILGMSADNLAISPDPVRRAGTDRSAVTDISNTSHMYSTEVGGLSGPPVTFMERVGLREPLSSASTCSRDPPSSVLVIEREQEKVPGVTSSTGSGERGVNVPPDIGGVLPSVLNVPPDTGGVLHAQPEAVCAPISSNRFSDISGWSGISGISAISGTGIGDSSFTSLPSGDDDQNHSKGMLEVNGQVPS